MRLVIGDACIEISKGDLTEMDTDAIVNAANDRLIMGGGVAGAILRKGGRTIQDECDRLGGTHVGGAVITGGGRLKARHVIHAVGPRMGEGDEDRKLRDATRNSLKVADGNDLTSVAFPAISTGIFGYPVERCAPIMLGTAAEHLRVGEGGLRRIVFVLYDEGTYGVFAAELRRMGGKEG